MPIRARVGGNRITLEGDERVRGKLKLVRRRLSDLRWLWGTVADLFVQKEAGWFTTRGGGSWPPLSPAYAAWKAVHYPGRPMLVQSGDLRRQLTTERTAVLAETDRALFLGTTIPYALYLAGGTSKMPARPPIIPPVSLVAGIARRVHLELERVF